MQRNQHTHNGTQATMKLAQHNGKQATNTAKKHTHRPNQAIMQRNEPHNRDKP